MNDDDTMREYCYKCGRLLEEGEMQCADGCMYCAGWGEEQEILIVSVFQTKCLEFCDFVWYYWGNYKINRR